MEIEEGTRVVHVNDAQTGLHGAVRKVNPDGTYVVRWDTNDAGEPAEHVSTEPLDTLRLEISPDEAGCWLDGHYGWHNTYRVVERAQALGMVLSADDTTLTDWYREHGSAMDVACTLPSGETLIVDDAWEAAAGQGGLSDKATEYLYGLAPVGYVFEWDAGEPCLIHEDELDV